MDILQIDSNDFEKILFFESINVTGIIAVHSTKLGPALGGVRIKNYCYHTEAVRDALNLARAMTYKNALVDLPFGGGKAVIMKKRGFNKIAALVDFSKVLNSLEGKYLATDDMGTDIWDMQSISSLTPFVKGPEYEGKQIPATAYGVYCAIKAAIFFKHGNKNLDGHRVLIQGLGKVGYNLCKFLVNDGCEVFVNDIDKKIQASVAAETLATQTNDILSHKIDVFSPCAVGGVVNENLAQKLKADYIIGGANNQLSCHRTEKILTDNGIIFIPDFLCNAGGVIDLSCEGSSYSLKNVYNKVKTNIYDKTLQILSDAKKYNQSPLEIASRYISKKLDENINYKKLNK